MRNREQGSVVGFVLGGMLLLALLVGGIMLYKNNISKLTGIADSDNKVASDDASSQAAQNEAALKQQQEAEKKAQAQNQAADNSADTTASGQSTTVQNATQVPHTSTAPTQALPKTGPAEDTLIAAAALSAFIGATVAYRRSCAAL